MGSLTFIATSLGGCVSILLNILIFFVICRRLDQFQSSFFRIFLVSSVVNLVLFLSSLFTFLLPSSTCFSCPLSFLFLSSSFPTASVNFLRWHCGSSQYLLSVVVAVDRFVVLLLDLKYTQKWNRFYAIVVVASLILPLFYTNFVLFNDGYYVFIEDYDNFMVETAASRSFIYASAAAIMISCSVCSLLFHGTIVYFLFSGRLKAKKTKGAEIKLLINSLVLFLLETVVSIFVVLQQVTPRESTFFETFRDCLNYGWTVLTLSPPFVILWSSHKLRKDLSQSLLPFSVRLRPPLPCIKAVASSNPHLGMHPSVFVLLAIGSSAVFATDAGYGAAPAQPQPAYQAQQPSYSAPQPAYNPPQPMYYQQVYQPAQYALPNYDVNYCTVHASFPLVDRKHKNHHRRDRRQAYGNFQQPATSYQSGASYVAPAYPPVFGGHEGRTRRFDRQYCRHTAIFSQGACNTCCQIASRSAGTPASQVSGALFVFDPNMDWDRRDSRESSERNDDEDKRVLQCVCCMPKSV